jgi:hypothetical protein
MDDSLNVFEEPLEECGENPITGFYRDGSCNTSDDDAGSHTVCILATQEFLEYSRFKGNDLSTPIPEFEFPGVNPGDSWCLCAARWWEAYNQGMAPRVYLRRTHKRALDVIPMDVLREYAVDLN